MFGVITRRNSMLPHTTETLESIPLFPAHDRLAIHLHGDARNLVLETRSRLHEGICTRLSGESLLTCGGSVAEAKALGCHFDLLAKAWLPHACPQHGLAEFSSLKTSLMGVTIPGRGGDHHSIQDGRDQEVGADHWRYYTAKHGGREIGVDELAAMGDRLDEDVRYWTTRREHSVHCAWMLLRLAHAYTNGLRGDHMVRRYEHTRHCVHNLLGKAMYAPQQDEIATQGNVVFGSC